MWRWLDEHWAHHHSPNPLIQINVSLETLPIYLYFPWFPDFSHSEPPSSPSASQTFCSLELFSNALGLQSHGSLVISWLEYILQASCMLVDPNCPVFLMASEPRYSVTGMRFLTVLILLKCASVQHECPKDVSLLVLSQAEFPTSSCAFMISTELFTGVHISMST
jgi:hypothetical protein